MTFNNRVAIVTGGAKGNGRGIVEALAKEGVKIAIFDFDRELDARVEEIRALGYDVIGFQCDIRSTEQVKAAVEGTIEKWGKIDILVNNAGVMACLPFLEADEKNRDFHIDVNIKGTWNVTQAVVPYMLEKNYGRIVILSSVTGGYVSDGEDTAYALTKAALLGFGRSIAGEYAKKGITCNMMCPGYIRTPMVEQYAKEVEPDDPEHFIGLLGQGLPIGRLGLPSDIGALAAYLACDEASFITGSAIVIDGGCILPETAALQ